MSRLDDYNARRLHSEKRDIKRRKLLRKAEKSARKKIKEEGRCRNPECSSGLPPEWHHATPRSKFGKWDTAKHDPDNAVPLCHTCHMLFHNGGTLPRSTLLPSEVKFILSHAGKAWLDKHYPEDLSG